MSVGSELALTAHVSSGEVVNEWHGEWVNWDEQGNSEVKCLPETAKASLDCTHQSVYERLVEVKANRASLGSPTHGHGKGFTSNFDFF